MRSYFREIYLSYNNKVYRFVSSFVQQGDDAQDITQEVFFHLWKHIKALHASDNPEAIIFKTAKQEVANYYRKKDKSLLIIGESELSTKPDQVADNDQHEDLEGTVNKIQSLLEQLPPRRRVFFLQNVQQDLSYSEIAERNNLSKSAVAKQISKAIAFIKNNL